MDVVKKLKSIVWCKEPWGAPVINEEAKQLLKQCTDITQPEFIEDIQEIIRRSNEFPIKFPIDTVRLEKLKTRIPVKKLQENIRLTYPLLHERVLILMANFLIYKRKYGTNIEKKLYAKMTVPELIDRILKKRAICFMKKQDVHLLRSGKKGEGGWESIGTTEEKPPLVLADYLSYDELKLSAFVSVSGPTACINDGTRRNSGIVKEDNIQTEAIIIGVIGPRFQRPNRMDCEDILITEEQNRPENGYGIVPANESATPKQMWRKLWADFYQIPSVTYTELTSRVQLKGVAARDGRLYTERYARRPRSNDVFDAAVYARRITLLADTALVEAGARAASAGRLAFLNVIGAGLGVWKISPHQLDLYILTFLERIHALLSAGALDHVADVNFAYIKPGDCVLPLFKSKTGGNASTSEKKLFFEKQSHPNGGIHVHAEDREPSAALRGPHAGKLLVLTYAWDGNAHPGNEFWLGKLATSGDPAAACSTQVAELHNAYINPAACGNNARVAGTRVHTLADAAKAMQ